MDPFLPPPDEDRPDRHGPAGFLRQHGGAVAGLLVALVVVVVAGPTIADRVGDGLQHDSVAAPVLAPSGSAPASSSTVQPAAAPTTVPATAASPAVTAAPSTTTLPGPAPAPVAAAVPVTTIQTVPALRDVIIEVDGQRLATDATGAITLTGGQTGGTVRVLGTIADPPVQTVDFAMWADGSLSSERPLDSLVGPVAQVGLVLRNRVVVRTPEPRPAGTTASFSSNVGVVELPVGEPSWVPAAFAVRSAEGLATVDATYSLETTSDGQPTGPQEFRPTPEATWLITT